MFGHHDVPVDAKAQGAAHALKGVLKDLPTRVRRKHETETTEGYEMALSGVVITLRAPRHEVSVVCWTSPLKAKEALSRPPVVENEKGNVKIQISSHSCNFTAMSPLVLVLSNITPVRFAT